MKVFYSESTEKPKLLDDLSSSTTTYVRSDVQESLVEDEVEGERVVYRYKEIQFSKEEYERLKEAQHTLDTEYRLSALEFKLI